MEDPNDNSYTKIDISNKKILKVRINISGECDFDINTFVTKQELDLLKLIEKCSSSYGATGGTDKITYDAPGHIHMIERDWTCVRGSYCPQFSVEVLP